MYFKENNLVYSRGGKGTLEPRAVAHRSLWPLFPATDEFQRAKNSLLATFPTPRTPRAARKLCLQFAHQAAVLNRAVHYRLALAPL